MALYVKDLNCGSHNVSLEKEVERYKRILGNRKPYDATNERCSCTAPVPKAPRQTQLLTLTFRDGDTTTTRFNGCHRQVVGHYTANNYIGRENPVVSVLFHETGKTIELPYSS